jgi:protein-disulfide isomerase
MAAKKIIEEEMPPEPDFAPADDVIVLKKSLVVNIGVAALFFILGAATMYVLFVLPANAATAALAQQQGQGAAAQPPQPPARLSNVGLGKLPPQGSPDAPVKIVEFSDFQCPFCKQWTDDTAAALKQKYGDKMVLYYRQFPLTAIHPEAMGGAIASECANEQGKFWNMHDSLFRTQSLLSPENSKSLAASLGLDATKYDDCVAKNTYQADIAADIADGNTYGVSGTPTFFINGVRLVGAQPLDQFSSVIDQELKK